MSAGRDLAAQKEGNVISVRPIPGRELLEYSQGGRWVYWDLTYGDHFVELARLPEALSVGPRLAKGMARAKIEVFFSLTRRHSLTAAETRQLHSFCTSPRKSLLMERSR
jgi:hypothetical protein